MRISRKVALVFFHAYFFKKILNTISSSFKNAIRSKRSFFPFYGWRFRGPSPFQAPAEPEHRTRISQAVQWGLSRGAVQVMVEPVSVCSSPL